MAAIIVVAAPKRRSVAAISDRSLALLETTISAAIANEFNEAVGELYISSLIALGLILFFITFAVLAIAKIMLMRMQKRAGG